MGKAKKAGDISTFIGPEASILGTIHFQNAIRLDGRVKGKIVGADGTLIVGKTAQIQGEISVDAAIIMGKVKGNISAKDRVEIYAPAQVTGDILAPIVSIEKGVRFNGKCGVKTNTVSPDGPDENDEKAVKIAPKN